MEENIQQSEEIQPKDTQQPTENIKALNVDILRILKNTPDAMAINIYYVVKGEEIDLRGMEIISPPKPEEIS